MSRVADLLEHTESFSGYMNGYVALLNEALSKVTPESLQATVAALNHTRHAHGDIYIAGNGGSTAAAMHWANDLISIQCRPAFRAHALSANASVLTCIGNDEGFSHTFSEQLAGRVRAIDLVILISASGSSPNLLQAAQAAQSEGARVISVVGFDGGALQSCSDILIHIPTSIGDYGIAEDGHLAVAHMVSNYLRHNT